MRILFKPSFFCACLAAMAALLKRQNPLARLGDAWCPGGLIMASPFCTLPSATCVTSSMADPADSLAACSDSPFMYTDSGTSSLLTSSMVASLPRFEI